jgi:hypothetical protein
MLWVVAIALLFVAAAAPGGPVTALLLLAGGFLASLHLHPDTRCEACKGTGTHGGSVFTYGFRPCHRCSGTRRKQRWLAGRQGLGEPRRSSTRWFSR